MLLVPSHFFFSNIPVFPDLWSSFDGNDSRNRTLYNKLEIFASSFGSTFFFFSAPWPTFCTCKDFHYLRQTHATPFSSPLLFTWFCSSLLKQFFMSALRHTWPLKGIFVDFILISSLSLSLQRSGYEPWPLFTFILENKINMSAVMYIFFPPTSFRLLFFHLPSARKIPNAWSSVCAGRTAAVWQGSSVKANERISCQIQPGGTK